MIPDETIRTFARTIVHEAQKYGFSSVDMVRLINGVMDAAVDARNTDGEPDVARATAPIRRPIEVAEYPLRSERVHIRRADMGTDTALLESWVSDAYGQYFLLSASTAQRHDVASLLVNPLNEIGIVTLVDGTPIGAVAFLEIDVVQRRAELRKLIGVAAERGKGYAEEATALWIEYGRAGLGLQKIYLSTLQTHLRNIQLNEAIGFRVEGILRGEILLGGRRHDVLRMGLCFEPAAG
jgi:RimJ/RimL family protein N-acetyltransferase